jgi:hypothetical protein
MAVRWYCCRSQVTIDVGSLGKISVTRLLWWIFSFFFPWPTGVLLLLGWLPQFHGRLSSPEASKTALGSSSWQPALGMFTSTQDSILNPQQLQHQEYSRHVFT